MAQRRKLASEWILDKGGNTESVLVCVLQEEDSGTEGTSSQEKQAREREGASLASEYAEQEVGEEGGGMVVVVATERVTMYVLVFCRNRVKWSGSFGTSYRRFSAQLN